MNFHRLLTLICCALAVGDAWAANPVARTLEDNDDSNLRKMCFVKKGPARAKLLAAFKKASVKLGGKVEIEVGIRGIIAVTYPNDGAVISALNYAQENGLMCGADEKRTLTSVKTSLRTTRKLSENIPWGIEKTYEEAGVPDLSFFDDFTTKKVCVIDTGYLSEHEDLPDGEISVSGANIEDSGGSCAYHGSHVAGTISAVGGNDVGVVGVCPSCGDGIRVAKVFKPVFFGILCGFVYSSGLIGASQDCLENGAMITNMSLGGGDPTAAEEEGFAELFNEGMIHIAASGNSGPDTISYPASYSSVISVGATDINDNIASFSSTNSQVDISAPGVNVLSTIGPGSNYDYYDGTSMATPHVVGATLALWNNFPGCTNQNVRDALESGADDLGAPGRDDEFGNGRLNFYKAAAILEASGCNNGNDCEDNPQSYNGKNCAWVAEKPELRCNLCNDNVCAADYCLATCPRPNQMC